MTRTVFAVAACLLSVSAAAQIPNDKLNKAISSGDGYLISAVNNNQYSLECQSNSSLMPCQVEDMGELFSGYFVAKALSVSNELPAPIAQKIYARINDERREGGYWGYSTNSPADADDTAFALRSLKLLGKPVDLKGLQHFYVPGEKAYVTLIGPTRRPTPTTKIHGFNNDKIHAEINANIFNLYNEAGKRNKINYSLIKNFQQKDGSWHGFFYPSKYYATYMNMSVLCLTNKDPGSVEQGKAFLLKSQNANGSWGAPESAYDTALAVNTLLTCNYPADKKIQKAITFLLSTQHEQGFWQSKQRVWEYIFTDDPFVKWDGYDNHHVVATALSVIALNKYKQAAFTKKSKSNSKI